MLEGKVSHQLGYEKYEAKGRNSGNSRNGKRSRGLQTSVGEVEIAVPRDRIGTYQPQVLGKYQTKTNELEAKIIAMYAREMSTHDIEAMLGETYGVNVSASLISAITDKVWPLVEAWQNRPLSTIYPIIYLDAMYVKLRREGKVEKIAVYCVLGVDLDGYRDVLGHWLGNGAEGAGRLAKPRRRRYLACLCRWADRFRRCPTRSQDAIEAIFPKTQVQRCIVHQIRNSLKYVVWKDQKAFMVDLRKVYQASTWEQAETQLLQLGERWGSQYAMAVRSWENNGDSLSTFFDYPDQIRRLIYTTTAIEGYHRQLSKVTKTKGAGAFPTPKSIRKLLYLANECITTTGRAAPKVSYRQFSRYQARATAQRLISQRL
jgi:transposase-like protein